MIKRLTFGRDLRGLDAPDGVRPVRLAVCTALPDLSDDDVGHDTVTIEWFRDADHASRYEAWAGPTPGDAPVVVAEEHVLRGADWLERRWRDGGERFKHLALARRAEGLTPAELSARWLAHAGRAGSSGTPIPPEARGLAYVQDHPCPRDDGAWPYDAVNEVWFDDLPGLEARVGWFREHGVGRTPDELFRRSWFLAAREQVLLA